jgi:hypothetical protein
MMWVAVQDGYKMRMPSCLGERSKLPYVMTRGTKVVNKGDEKVKYMTTGIGVPYIRGMFDGATSRDRCDRGDFKGVSRASK